MSIAFSAADPKPALPVRGGDDPDSDAATWFDQADALIAQDRLADAARALEAGLRRSPALSGRRLVLVTLLERIGRRDLAYQCIAQGLAVTDIAPLYLALARLLRQDGRPEDAIAACHRALDRDPASDDAVIVLAELIAATDRPGAIARLERALGERPGAAKLVRALALLLGPAERERAEAMLRGLLDRPAEAFGAGRQLAVLLYEQGRFVEAVEALTPLVLAHPDDSTLLLEFGIACRDADRVDLAEHALRRSIALGPTLPEPRIALIRLLAGQRRMVAAIAEQEQLLAHHPTLWAERANLGLNLLAIGQYERGFRELEHRWKTDLKSPEGAGWFPRWRGEPLAGRSLWLHPEQGFGDMLQFLRFVPLLRNRGGPLILGIFPEIARLAADLGADEIITDSMRPSGPVLRCPLMSVPHYLGITAETLPTQVPYLRVPDGVRARWRGRLDHLPGLKVGLVWAGNPEHVQDRERSLTLARLAPLAGVLGVSFVSLQVGPAATVPADSPLQPLVLEPFEDFADTGAVLEQLDLVIGVDTGVLHLAGALGRPTWLMLPFSNDWRWGVEADSTIWYPHHRLFRQSRPGDWDGVIARLVDALQNEVSRSRLS